MNTLPNHLWADSMSDWADHNRLTIEEKNLLTADYTPADRHEGASYTAHRALPLPADRMWTPRRCSADMAREQTLAQFHNDDCGFPFEAASSCTEIGAEPETQTESADSEVAWFIAKLVAAICAAVYIVSSYAGR